MAVPRKRDTLADPQCPACLPPVRDADFAIRLHGELLHIECWQLNGDGMPRERAAVQCAACTRGIRRVQDMLIYGGKPVHLDCFKNASKKRKERPAKR